MKLEVGKLYKTKSGSKAFIYYRNNDGEFYGSIAGIDGLRTYCIKGRYKASPLFDRGHNIVSEWHESKQAIPGKRIYLYKTDGEYLFFQRKLQNLLQDNYLGSIRLEE